MTTQGYSQTPSMAETFRIAFDYYLEDLNTAMPGRIEEYDPLTQKAQIQPMIDRLLGDQDGEEILERLPVLVDVPVMFPRSAGFFQSFPVVVGDFCLVVFNQRSIDTYLAAQNKDLAAGQTINPNDFRRHELTDAVALMGFHPFSLPIKDIHPLNMVVGKDEGGIQIHMTPDGKLDIKVNGTADVHVAIAETLKIFWESAVKPYLDAQQHPTSLGISGPPITPAPSFDDEIISDIVALKNNG